MDVLKDQKIYCCKGKSVYISAWKFYKLGSEGVKYHCSPLTHIPKPKLWPYNIL